MGLAVLMPFTDVRGRVAVRAEPFGQCRVFRRNRLSLPVDGKQCSTGQHHGATGHADSAGRSAHDVGMGERSASLHKAVQVGRRGVLVPVATQVWPVVLTGDPQDVGLCLECLGLDRTREQDKRRRGAL